MFWLHLSAHWGDLIEQIKKICHIHFNLGTFKSRHRWFGFRIFSPTLLVIGVGSRLLPIIFFCITSLMLEPLFDDLQGNVTIIFYPNGPDKLQDRVHKICKVVEPADKVLDPLLLVFVSMYIPLFCFSFYNVARGRDEDLQRYFLFNLLWFLLQLLSFHLFWFFDPKLAKR